MIHDRIHAREPAHHRDRWSVGTIESIEQRDGHCVVTLAIRDLFLSRLDTDEGASPVGERV